MEAGLHLPLIDFEGEGLSQPRMIAAVDAASACGWRTVAANDHLVFAAPWLDGPTSLASVVERSGDMHLMTSLALPVVRHPVPLAKTLTALDVLSGGRVLAGVGPGSSKADYEAVGVPFDERWPRFDESVRLLRDLLQPGRHAPVPGAPALMPAPHGPEGIPLWIGSWGSRVGLRRVARLGDGWLASAYNTDPDTFASALETLRTELSARGRPAELPAAIGTMWTFVTEDRPEAERVLSEVLGPMLGRDPDVLRGRVCVGPPDECIALLSRYAQAGCRRVLFWPLRDEAEQVEALTNDVLPLVS